MSGEAAVLAAFTAAVATACFYVFVQDTTQWWWLLFAAANATLAAGMFVLERKP